MESIISPWFFYFLELAETIKNVSFVFAVLSGMFLLVAVIAIIVVNLASEFDKDDEERLIPMWKKMLRRSITPFIIFTFLAIFVPTKNTLIWMVVAKNVTYDNVETAIKAGKDVKNELKMDIIDIINELQGEEKEATKNE